MKNKRQHKIQEQKVLPRNFYDGIKTLRPYMMPSVLKDVEKLRLMKIDGPINSDDAYHSSVEEIARAALLAYMQIFAKHFGLQLEQVFDGRMPILNRFPAELVANISSELRALVKVIGYEYFCLVNFELAGKKVFRFEDRLLSELAQTSSNVLCDFVHLPFKSCLFVCQSILMVNAIQRFESGTSADADLLKTIEGCDYETPVSIFVTELPADNKYEHPILSILVIQSDEQVMRSVVGEPYFSIPQSQ